MHETAHLSRRAAAALPLAALFGPAAATVPALATANRLDIGTDGFPDAELVSLGRRWEEALAAERAHYGTFGIDHAMSPADVRAHDAIGDKLYDVRSALFDQIEKTPATTPTGLAVKARILAYENDVEMNEASIAAALAATRYFTDRVALSLALDCLRMARASA